ncbi:hypothetical protein CTAYLR_009475 [Chrysophaeum taylorii]|uniref:Uncharacterized protein n=1 Tax=Chrysophaeum taylorii TaxID=2483200 RepID=A0AAD7XPC9_9STRA|nr:hypothetical protein CTAYLR_009475 [Chrysophaeum taylorii]
MLVHLLLLLGSVAIELGPRDPSLRRLGDQFEAIYGDLTGRREAARAARERAELEQQLEDYNAIQRASGAFHRALLVLPLNEKFDPPPGSPGHGKLQFSDKVSMPRDIGAELARRQLEVPWQFEVEAVNEPFDDLPWKPPLTKIFCSPLDFRAPANYLFVPLWMMHQLRLKPYDPVKVTWVKLKNGASIKLVSHQDSFLKLSNPRAILESELKYYSAATRGATISLVYNGRQFDFDVDDCVGTVVGTYRPERCDGVSIQDADVSLDLAPVGLDVSPRRNNKPDAPDAAD